jgi:tricarballylate dehydrogenase
MSETRIGPPEYDVVVIGCGVAGLSAAVSCAEGGAGDSVDARPRVAVLERTGRLQRGGNSRWTAAYLRLRDEYTPAEGFLDDMLGFSDGRSDRAYLERLVERLPETMDWLQSLGVRLQRLPTIFITKAKPRLLPVGGGERVIDLLAERAERLGVEFLYQTTALRLATDDEGRVTGVVARREGTQVTIRARAVIIASGGFGGNPEMMTQYLGPGAGSLPTIAEGGQSNRGEGIRMALELGAKPTGEWGNFHAEPVDPRSRQPEAVVMTFPYGILVNRQARRFIDEGSGTADEIYENVARTIWRQDGQIAYLIADQSHRDIPGSEHALLTDRPAVTAETIEDLAGKLELDPARLAETVREYNAGTSLGDSDPTAPDGRATTGLTPPKSNWAQPLDKPPFLAYPVVCSVVFTFGGIGTNPDAEVVTADGFPIPGLYAAGECTGLYYGKYPGATSVMRGLVFGRIAGRGAAAGLGFQVQSRVDVG